METLLKRFPGLENTPLAWLVGAMTMAVLPHLVRTPLWIPLVYSGLALWCLAHAKAEPGSTAKNSASGLFKLVVGTAVVAGVFASYGTLTGRDAGVALLILLAGMKLVEFSGPRDYYISVFIGLFLLLTNFLYTQSLFSAAYMGIAVAVFLQALLAFNDPGSSLDTGARLRKTGAMLLQALPLMLVMFVLFPRVNGPLWGLPQDAHSGVTGLDDQMSLGNIAQVSQSDQVAFRVEFQGPIPPRRELYWRGPVLMFTDGVQWVADRPRHGPPPVEVSGPPVQYTITMEPTSRSWLYSLELADEPPLHSHFTEDMQIRTNKPVNQRIRYTLESHTHYRMLSDDKTELKRALQLPPDSHPRTVALAKSWKQDGLSEIQIVQRALDMFHNQPFYYTLTPPPLLGDTIDEFLFQTRRGFCEHYAAAFVVLMRAAGIPARIVTGYQGGKINPIGHYLVVRQRDAHAWAEVWLNGKGWIREDPTAAVAPNRILEGMDAEFPATAVNVPLGLQDNAVARNLWERFSDSLDAINNGWNQWVLGYDQRRQSLLLTRIGLGWLNTQELGVGLVIILVAGMVVVAVWLFKGMHRKVDPARRLYDQFCKRLARLGASRRQQEGPRHFARRASMLLRPLKAQIDQITDLYVTVRYAGHPDRLPDLKRAVKAFRP